VKRSAEAHKQTLCFNKTMGVCSFVWPNKGFPPDAALEAENIELTEGTGNFETPEYDSQ